MKTNHERLVATHDTPGDTLTILWAQADKLATKQFSKTSFKAKANVKSYDAGFLYTVLEPIGISCIEELSAVLTIVEGWPRALIIRGAPVSADMVGKDIARTGSGEGPDFVGNFKTPDAGRYYLEVDVDKFDLPAGLKLVRANVNKICQHIVQQLPPEFHQATYHWQLSSSAGVFDMNKVSLHLWFWLVYPVPDAELKRWAKHVNQVAGIKLVDPALFQHVQAHYVAAPLFKGMADPFPVRSGLTVKSSNSVDLQLPAPEPVALTGTAVSTRTLSPGGGSGFDYFLGQIGDHPGGSGFHMPIVQAVASYIAEHGSEGTDTEHLYSIVRDRVLAADGSAHSQAEVADRASGTHILSAIGSALRKYGDTTTQRRKSRRIEGIKPHFQGEYQDAATIESSLRDILDEAF